MDGGGPGAAVLSNPPLRPPYPFIRQSAAGILFLLIFLHGLADFFQKLVAKFAIFF